MLRVPSPAERPEELSAEELILELLDRGARVYRMRDVAVFCLTSDAKLAAWLHEHGATTYMPQHAARNAGGLPLGAYRRAHDSKIFEWDFWIHRVPVIGDESVWEAAGRLVPTVEPEDFA